MVQPFNLHGTHLWMSMKWIFEVISKLIRWFLYRISCVAWMMCVCVDWNVSMGWSREFASCCFGYFAESNMDNCFQCATKWWRCSENSNWNWTISWTDQWCCMYSFFFRERERERGIIKFFGPILDSVSNKRRSTRSCDESTWCSVWWKWNLSILGIAWWAQWIYSRVSSRL